MCNRSEILIVVIVKVEKKKFSVSDFSSTEKMEKKDRESVKKAGR